MSDEAQPHSSAAPCECCSTYSGHVFTSSKLGSIFFSACLLMLASCPPSTRCPAFRATVGETAVAQLCHVTSPSDHLLPALTRSRPVVLITACFSAPRPICLTLIRLIFQCKKLWDATALRIPAQICARLQLEGPIRHPPPRSQYSANPVKSPDIHSKMAATGVFKREARKFKSVA